MVSMQTDVYTGENQQQTVPRPSSIVNMILEGINGDSGERRILGEENTFEVNKVQQISKHLSQLSLVIIDYSY